MKNTMRVLSVMLVMMLCLGLLAACGNTSAGKDDTTNAPTTEAVPTGDTTEPFVAPADQVGLVVSADPDLVTWQTYAVEGETVDFLKVDVKALGNADAEMTLFYLEEEVTYYAIVDGKLEKTTAEAVVPGSVIGITTLEEGVQEVYILVAPAEDDGSDDYQDPLGEIIEETIPAETTPAEEVAPEQEAATEGSDFEYEGTPTEVPATDDGV